MSDMLFNLCDITRARLPNRQVDIVGGRVVPIQFKKTKRAQNKTKIKTLEQLFAHLGTQQYPSLGYSVEYASQLHGVPSPTGTYTSVHHCLVAS